MKAYYRSTDTRSCRYWDDEKCSSEIPTHYVLGKYGRFHGFVCEHHAMRAQMANTFRKVGPVEWLESTVNDVEKEIA